MNQTLQSLKEVRTSLAALADKELDLMRQLVRELNHDKLGSKTYDVDGEKVAIKTSENIRIDKTKLSEVWTEDMPFNRKYDFSIKQKEFDEVMKSGSVQERKALSELVTTSPARPSIKIGV